MSGCFVTESKLSPSLPKVQRMPAAVKHSHEVINFAAVGIPPLYLWEH